ncbi:hypothetical protein MNB_SUP05-12-1096 [hydrothermal vent metagenome]|uniref:Uncharacterized protein n=1 Tax=hydrothermal vent metagenome TaxID=652676 RepID=A0A1W1DHK2_9ZZZZ
MLVHLIHNNSPDLLLIWVKYTITFFACKVLFLIKINY